jgi:nucleotide-binding universal stress UspA family protein
MFKMILQANDGSTGAFKALALTLELAQQTGAELHMVCVEEISEFPETIGDVTTEKRAADRKFRGVLQRARTMADAQHVKLQTHLLIGSRADRIVHLAFCPVLVVK